MPYFIPILEEASLSNISVAKALLDAQKIVCFVQESAMNSIGVKLLVKSSDFEQAKTILTEAGFLKRTPRLIKYTPISYKLSEHFHKIWDKLIIINLLTRPFRKIVFIAFFAILFIGIWFFSLTPETTYEKLASKQWCINHISYKGKNFLPNSLGFRGHDTNCLETIYFHLDSSIQLPGFHTNEINGKWKLVDEKLYISDADTFGFVYEGMYEITIQGERKVVLTSPTTIIYFNKPISTQPLPKAGERTRGSNVRWGDY